MSIESTIINVNGQKYANLPLPIPPSTNETVQILTFLDERTAALDALIAKKRRQIDLLQEQRAALINQVVTKGLDRNRPMKDSGVPWIGEIPAEWKAKRLRHICKLEQGLQIPRSERLHERATDAFEYITIKSIHNPDADKEFIHKPSPRVTCTADDILFARTGATGQVITNQTGAFHNNFFLVDYDRNRTDKEFLYYYLQNSRLTEYLILRAGTTTIPDLNHNDFLDAPFVEPSIDEQKAISSWLVNSLNRVDSSIGMVQRQIELINEYRTALISAAVTGKIDVRHHATQERDHPGRPPAGKDARAPFKGEIV